MKNFRMDQNSLISEGFSEEQQLVTPALFKEETYTRFMDHQRRKNEKIVKLKVEVSSPKKSKIKTFEVTSRSA